MPCDAAAGGCGQRARLSGRPPRDRSGPRISPGGVETRSVGRRSIDAQSRPIDLRRLSATFTAEPDPASSRLGGILGQRWRAPAMFSTDIHARDLIELLGALPSSPATTRAHILGAFGVLVTGDDPVGWWDALMPRPWRFSSTISGGCNTACANNSRRCRCFWRRTTPICRSLKTTTVGMTSKKTRRTLRTAPASTICSQASRGQARSTVRNGPWNGFRPHRGSLKVPDGWKERDLEDFLWANWEAVDTDALARVAPPPFDPPGKCAGRCAKGCERRVRRDGGGRSSSTASIRRGIPVEPERRRAHRSSAQEPCQLSPWKARGAKGLLKIGGGGAFEGRLNVFFAPPTLGMPE